MKKFEFQPADLIAIIIIVGVMIMNFKGIDTMLSQSVLLIVGYYFGRTLKQSSDQTAADLAAEPKAVVIVPPIPSELKIKK